ncbi:hypothetical protein [uncultured Rikenella sp.]|uniref:hypothetical protein n=1 Tax=uncultured Rikenella sp. TaxID=368003 RepID=UPI0026328726|nr:hypothetical protein [uncultured Rikenella sp.]
MKVGDQGTKIPTNLDVFPGQWDSPKKRAQRKTAPNSIKSEGPGVGVGVGLVHQPMFGRRAGFDHGIGQELLHRETKAASGASIVL